MSRRCKCGHSSSDHTGGKCDVCPCQKLAARHKDTGAKGARIQTLLARKLAARPDVALVCVTRRSRYGSTSTYWPNGRYAQSQDFFGGAADILVLRKVGAVELHQVTVENAHLLREHLEKVQSLPSGAVVRIWTYRQARPGRKEERRRDSRGFMRTVRARPPVAARWRSYDREGMLMCEEDG